jgi:glucosamine--fructose-6-phosphate aminotransferase (isomerizing)
MCGIVGYTGARPASDILIRGLRRLEYRGYDSTGVALLQSGRIEIRKSSGKLIRVEEILESEPGLREASKCGIGHTRWATHGKPTTQNAHPHRVGHVVLVHNGIIENYQEIRDHILASGKKPISETDSELFGFLVLERMDRGADLVTAVRESFRELKGQCSVVVLSEKEPGKMVGVRNGSPLVATVDPQGGVILASDAQPLIEYNRDVYFLENGDVCVGTSEGIQFLGLESGKKIARESQRLDWSVEKIEKGGYAHHMLKEIHEQPTALIDTLNALLDREHTDPFPLAVGPVREILAGAQNLVIVACGTSWHASWVGKYWIERMAGVPVQVELASEFRYRDPVLMPGTVVMGVTQSGETADTLAVLRDVRTQGYKTLAITNVRGSTVSREVDATLYTAAGPEIGVAATKTFSAQMLALLSCAGFLARAREGTQAVDAFFHQLVRMPHLLSELLMDERGWTRQVQAIARDLQQMKGFFFIGRGFSFPLALEGALKLKEIAYVPAEGYAAGELKHGPIAMIDEGMAVIVIAPDDTWRDKTVSNLEEVKARGARIIGIGCEGDSRLESLCDHWLPLPRKDSTGTLIDEGLQPFLVAPALQLLSYELAKLHGTDIDQPRNLAKSVTVE